MEMRTITMGELNRLAAAGKHAVQIASELGVPASRVYYWARKWKVQVKSVREVCSGDADDPTTDQIAERAEAIRLGWSREETARRMIGGPRRWRAPTVSTTASFK
jgi:hypothetical protein